MPIKQLAGNNRYFERIGWGELPQVRLRNLGSWAVAASSKPRHGSDAEQTLWHSAHLAAWSCGARARIAIQKFSDCPILIKQTTAVLGAFPPASFFPAGATSIAKHDRSRLDRTAADERPGFGRVCLVRHVSGDACRPYCWQDGSMTRYGTPLATRLEMNERGDHV